MLRVLDSLELHQIVFFCSQDLPKGIKWWQTHFYILFGIINVVPTIIIYIVITVHKIAEAHKLSIKTRLIAERYRYIHILTKNYSFRLTKFINKECSSSSINYYLLFSNSTILFFLRRGNVLLYYHTATP